MSIMLCLKIDIMTQSIILSIHKQKSPLKYCSPVLGRQYDISPKY